MKHQPIDVFEDFRRSMLAKSDEWTNLIAENVHLVGPLADVTGREAFIAINTPFFQSIRGYALHESIAKGEYVITQISVEVATPSGAVVTLHVSEWYKIEDGKIQSLRTYFDPAVLLAAMNPG